MEPDLIAAAAALAETLARENAALTALDLAKAGGFLAEKSAAATALAQAVQRTRQSGGLSAAQRPQAERLGARLRELGEENRRLLERAIHVQGRVLASIAKALPRAQGTAARYGASGHLTGARRVQAIAFSARA